MTTTNLVRVCLYKKDEELTLNIGIPEIFYFWEAYNAMKQQYLHIPKESMAVQLNTDRFFLLLSEYEKCLQHQMATTLSSYAYHQNNLKKALIAIHDSFQLMRI